MLTIRNIDLGFHDLDELAGCWSQAEAKSFDAKIADFSLIDKDLWK
jgi:hypothetical protein